MYRRSTRKGKAKKSLGEFTLLHNSKKHPAATSEVVKNEAAKNEAAKNEAAAGEPEKTAEETESARKVTAEAVPVYSAANAGHVPRLRRIGTSVSTDSTRVTIDLQHLAHTASPS